MQHWKSRARVDFGDMVEIVFKRENTILGNLTLVNALPARVLSKLWKFAMVTEPVIQGQ